jgi:hypothetical protein
MRMNNSTDNAGDAQIKFNFGIIGLREVFDLTTSHRISEEDFHLITGYNYQGIKKSRGWN